ncbi:hypothetical protein KP509_02G037600 [Ceratopteris richardii]|uniref:Uncharacterized protein n=1 Tax=Ceratopteris richardii TaxID=49495 RepID=A0A8T2VGB5_CERRI|nr:hypothetical protein KP509_02G037600 [Ceratopteris richardii]
MECLALHVNNMYAWWLLRQQWKKIDRGGSEGAFSAQTASVVETETS